MATDRRRPRPPLGREEYIEQAPFLSALGERLAANVPAQEVLASVREEVLATTKLPLAIDFPAGRVAARRRARPGDGAVAPLLHAVSGVRHPGIGKRAAAVRSACRAGILRREAEYRAESRRGLHAFLFTFCGRLRKWTCLWSGSRMNSIHGRSPPLN